MVVAAFVAFTAFVESDGALEGFINRGFLGMG